MEKIDNRDSYKEEIEALTDEKLAEQYLRRERYIKKYIKLLTDEVANRNLSIAEFAPDILKKKSNKNLFDIYKDFANEKDIQILVDQEITNRGFNIETLEEEIEFEKKLKKN
jgi:hypothetical protein